MNRFKIILSILALLFLACTAFASEDMINPHFADAHSLPQLPSDLGITPRGRVSVKLSMKGTATLNKDTVFSASASGGNGKYKYCYYIIDPNDKSDENPAGNPHGYSGPIDTSDYSYRFVVPGTYLVLVYVRDTRDNMWDATATLQFTIKDKKAETTKDAVKRIVKECKASGCNTDYDKALWLHDWLINNAYYDDSYSYYSADGVLIRGCGVCDSYSKAYLMLLEEAGVKVKRVTNSSHAWNLVKLGDDWYHIDPTYDDPIVRGKETTTVTGYEFHLYFGLPDSIMKLDRSFQNYSGTQTANGTRYNYYLQPENSHIWTDSFSKYVRNGLNAIGYDFLFVPPNYYKLENGKSSYGKDAVIYSIAQYALSDIEWELEDQTFKLNCLYNPQINLFRCTMVFTDDKTLKLPAAITEISDEAFTGKSRYLAIDLPHNVTSIGNRSFADNDGLWKIYIPESVSEISSSAFEGSDNVTIICKRDSFAEKYARANEIPYKITA